MHCIISYLCCSKNNLEHFQLLFPTDISQSSTYYKFWTLSLIKLKPSFQLGTNYRRLAVVQVHLLEKHLPDPLSTFHQNTLLYIINIITIIFLITIIITVILLVPAHKPLVAWSGPTHPPHPSRPSARATSEHHDHQNDLSCHGDDDDYSSHDDDHHDDEDDIFDITEVASLMSRLGWRRPRAGTTTTM